MLGGTPEAKASGAPPAVDDEAVPQPKRRGPVPWAWIGRGVVAAALLTAVAWGWQQLSRRQQQNVHRHLNEAVKMAKGAYQSMHAPDDKQPGASGNPRAPGAPRGARGAPVTMRRLRRR